VRYFNTTGPCDPALHYMLPASARLPRARQLIEEGRYFVVHAPRQTGKTTTVTALAREVTATGGHAALRVSIEAAGPWGRASPRLNSRFSTRSGRPRIGNYRQAYPWPAAAPGRRLGQGLINGCIFLEGVNFC
jgi:hypothetical protein